MWFFNLLKELKSYSLLLSTLLIIIGVILFINPIDTVLIVSQIIGLMILISGIRLIFKYFSDKSMIGSYILALGFFISIIGSVLIIKPTIIVSFLSFIIGVIIIIHALIDFQKATDGRRLYYNHWKILFGIGVLKALLACIILFAPFFTTASILSAVGIVLIVEGISNIITILKLSKEIETLKNNDDIID